MIRFLWRNVLVLCASPGGSRFVLCVMLWGLLLFSMCAFIGILGQCVRWFEADRPDAKASEIPKTLQESAVAKGQAREAVSVRCAGC